MDEVAILFAKEDIRTLKARYFRAVDTKDWAMFDTIFTDDVTCDYRGAATDPGSGVNAAPAATETVLRGRAAAVDAMAASLEGVVTVHQGFMPEIEVQDAEHATALWAMQDTLRLPAGAPFAELAGWGHYHETYRRIDGGWRIATLRLTRLRVDAVPLR